jgi:hypothetical protein
MGLLSDRKTVRKIDRLRGGVLVHDTFESKPSYQNDYPAGVVVVLDGFPYRNPRRFVGKSVKIVAGSNNGIRATINDARDHATTISFFFESLTERDVPIGALVFLED